MPLFKKFRDNWTKIDTTQYSTGIEVIYVENKLQNHIEDINQFVQEQLDFEQPREDYKELLVFRYLLVNQARSTMLDGCQKP